MWQLFFWSEKKTWNSGYGSCEKLDARDNSKNSCKHWKEKKNTSEKNST